MPSFTPADADCFFERNRQNLTEPRDDIVLPLLGMYGVKPRKPVDIGCANAYKLAAICEAYDLEDGWGIDPSAIAIADGLNRWPYLCLHEGSLYHLPFATAVFDLALAVFVFHWIDRSLLLRSVAEIDRVLAPGGYLLIADFAPDHPEAVPYKHREGLYTYKQPYHELFTAGLGYRLVAYLEFDHDSRELRPDVPSEQRAFKALLRKCDAD